MNIKELLFSDKANVKLKGCCGTPDEVCDIDLNDISNEVDFCCSTTIPGNLNFTQIRDPRIAYSFKDKLRCCLDTCQVECEVAEGFSCFANVTLVRIVGCIEYAISVPEITGDLEEGPGRVHAGCSGTVCVNNLVCIRCSQDDLNAQQTLDFCPNFTTDDVEVDLDEPQIEVCNNITKVTFTGTFTLPDGDCPITPPPPPPEEKCECCMTITGASGNQDFIGSNPGINALFDDIAICINDNSSDPTVSCLECACGEDVATTSIVKYSVVVTGGPNYTMSGESDTFEVTCDTNEVTVEGQGIIGSNIVDFTLTGIDGETSPPSDQFSMEIRDSGTGDIIHSTDGLIDLNGDKITVNDCPPPL